MSKFVKVREHGVWTPIMQQRKSADMTRLTVTNSLFHQMLPGSLIVLMTV